MVKFYLGNNSMDNPAFESEEVKLNYYKPCDTLNRRRTQKYWSKKLSPVKISTENGISTIGNVSLEERQPEVEGGLSLKKELGLISATAMIVGSMIGSGIFISPGDLLKRTGSVGLSLVIWGACGVLSTLGAICYIELGTVVDSCGAEYAYLLAAMGSLPAFLFAWVCTLVLRPALVAVISLSFAEYSVQAIAGALDAQTQQSSVKIITTAAILLITFCNCYSVQLSAQIQNIFTAAKLIAIAIIIGTGIYNLCLGHTESLNDAFAGSTTSVGKIAAAFYSGLWAYDGWNTLNFVTEEIKNPYRNLPLAILIGLPLVTVCYILVNIAYLTVLTPQQIMDSTTVAYDFGNKALGSAAFLMPLSVALSTFGAANGALFATGRLAYAASREGHLPEVLSYLDVTRLTPCPALIFNAIVAILMISIGNIGSLIDVFNFTAWIFYGGAVLALIILRYKRPDAPRPFKVPIVIPVIVLLASIYLIIAPIIDTPQIEYLYACIFIVGGLVFFVPCVYYKVPVPCLQVLYTNLLISDTSDVLLFMTALQLPVQLYSF